MLVERSEGVVEQLSRENNPDFLGSVQPFIERKSGNEFWLAGKCWKLHPGLMRRPRIAS